MYTAIAVFIFTASLGTLFIIPPGSGLVFFPLLFGPLLGAVVLCTGLEGEHRQRSRQ